MNCSDCGSEQPEGAKFCFACGVNLEEALDRSKICPKCGVDLVEGATFCIECGRKLIDDQMLKEAKSPEKPKENTFMRLCPRCKRQTPHKYALPPQPRAAPLSGNLSGAPGQRLAMPTRMPVPQIGMDLRRVICAVCGNEIVEVGDPRPF